MTCLLHNRQSSVWDSHLDCNLEHMRRQRTTQLTYFPSDPGLEWNCYWNLLPPPSLQTLLTDDCFNDCPVLSRQTNKHSILTHPQRTVFGWCRNNRSRFASDKEIIFKDVCQTSNEFDALPLTSTTKSCPTEQTQKLTVWTEGVSLDKCKSYQSNRYCETADCQFVQIVKR